MSTMARKIREHLLNATPKSTNHGNLQEARLYKLYPRGPELGGDLIYISRAELSKRGTEGDINRKLLTKGFVGPYIVNTTPMRGKPDARYVKYKVIGRSDEAASAARAEIESEMEAAERQAMRQKSEDQSEAMKKYHRENKDVTFLKHLDKVVASTQAGLRNEQIMLDNAFSGRHYSRFDDELDRFVPAVEGPKLIHTIKGIDIDSDENNLILRNFTFEDQANRNFLITPSEFTPAKALVAAGKGSEFEIRQNLAFVRSAPIIARKIRDAAKHWATFNKSGNAEKDAQIDKVRDMLVSMADGLEKKAAEVAGPRGEIESKLHTSAIRVVAQHNEQLRKEQDDKFRREFGAEKGESKEEETPSKDTKYITNITIRTDTDKDIKTAAKNGLLSALLAPLSAVEGVRVEGENGEVEIFKFKRDGDKLRLLKRVDSRPRKGFRTTVTDRFASDTVDWQDVTPYSAAQALSADSEMRSVLSTLNSYFSGEQTGDKIVTDDEDLLTLSLMPDRFKERLASMLQASDPKQLEDIMVAEMQKSGMGAKISDLASSAADEAVVQGSTQLKNREFQQNLMRESIEKVSSPEQINETLGEIENLMKEDNDRPMAALSAKGLDAVERFADYVAFANAAGEEAADKYRSGSVELTPEEFEQAEYELEKEANESPFARAARDIRAEVKYQYARAAERAAELKEQVLAERAFRNKEMSDRLSDFETRHFGQSLKGKMDDYMFKDKVTKEQKVSTIGKFASGLKRSSEFEQRMFNRLVDVAIFDEEHPESADSEQEPGWFKNHLRNIKSGIVKRWNAALTTIKNLNAKISSGMATGTTRMVNSVASGLFMTGITRIASELGSAWTDIITAAKNPKFILAIAGESMRAAFKGTLLVFAAKFAEEFADRLFSSGPKDGGSGVARTMAKGVMKAASVYLVTRTAQAAYGTVTPGAPPAEDQQDVVSEMKKAATDPAINFIDDLFRSVPGLETMYNTLSGNEDSADLVANMINKRPGLSAHSTYDPSVRADMFNEDFGMLINPDGVHLQSHDEGEFVVDNAKWKVTAYPEGVSKIHIQIFGRDLDGGSPFLRTASGQSVTVAAVKKYFEKNPEVLPTAIQRKDGGGSIGLDVMRAIGYKKGINRPHRMNILNNNMVILTLNIRPEKTGRHANPFPGKTIEQVTQFFDNTLLQKGRAKAERAKRQKP